MFGWFKGPRVITPVAVRRGDDLVIAMDDPAALDDAVPLMHTLQDQFPGVRLHLLIGFGSIQIAHNQRDDAPADRGDEHTPDEPQNGPAVRDPVDVAPVAKPAAERNAVVLRHSAGGRIILTSIPPEVEG